MRCLIVDDEPLAVGLMEDFISQVPFLTLVNKCRNAFECVQYSIHQIQSLPLVNQYI